MLGVHTILSVSAVGSLKESTRRCTSWSPTSSWTARTQRATTFFGRGLVAHVAFAHPFCAGRREIAGRRPARRRRRVHHVGGTYVCIEGPQFSTRAESELYRSWGMDVIGMTNLTEAKLAREAEICYATLALVTDYDCWHPEHDAVTVDQIMANLTQNVATAKAVLRVAVRRGRRAGRPASARTRCATRW